MAEVTLENASKKAQDLFNKGFSALERGNLDYAVELLSACVEFEPGFLQARKFLRAAQIKRFKARKTSAISSLMTTLTTLPAYLQAVGTAKANKPQAAMLLAEKLLSANPMDTRFIRLFSNAAGAAKLPEAAIQTLEIARDHSPQNPVILRMLGALLQQVGRTGDAKACFEKLCEITPNDPVAVKALKDSMALDSMRTDGWSDTAEKKGTFREIIRDTKQTQILEQQGKAVKSEKDADALIADALTKIEAEPGNVNFYRALARLYVQKKDFAKAIQTVEKALELNPGDPELENNLSDIRLQEFDAEAQKLTEAGDLAGAKAATERKERFEYDDMESRVKRYPNDLTLRHNWGRLLFERGQINESIQQFQLSQRSPKHRIRSLYYLAMCFKNKKQYDLARDQLKEAASELVPMDGTKKDILYELGVVSEAMGEVAKAAEYFKQIYQVDIGYKDVAQKMEKAYRR